MQFEFHRDFFWVVIAARTFVAFFGFLEWQEGDKSGLVEE